MKVIWYFIEGRALDFTVLILSLIFTFTLLHHRLYSEGFPNEIIDWIIVIVLLLFPCLYPGIILFRKRRKKWN